MTTNRAVFLATHGHSVNTVLRNLSAAVSSEIFIIDLATILKKPYTPKINYIYQGGIGFIAGSNNIMKPLRCSQTSYTLAGNYDFKKQLLLISLPERLIMFINDTSTYSRMLLNPISKLTPLYCNFLWKRKCCVLNLGTHIWLLSRTLNYIWQPQTRTGNNTLPHRH